MTAEQKIERALTDRAGWMTNEQVGQILALADEVPIIGTYEEALEWIKYVRTEGQAQEYMEQLMEAIEDGY